MQLCYPTDLNLHDALDAAQAQTRHEFSKQLS
jgi:hypothetical protein